MPARSITDAAIVLLAAVVLAVLPARVGFATTAIATTAIDPSQAAPAVPVADAPAPYPAHTCGALCRDRNTAAYRLAQLAASPSTAADSVGVVSSLQGSATVTRNGATTALRVQDEIWKGDVLKTAPASTLGVIFDDETTFSLTANASIVVDDFLYQEGGDRNVATFKFAQGTVAFVANAVAKTGTMTLTTPTATMGIRGTTGLVDVGPTSGPAGSDAIKLYPDADGKVGRIEVTARDGTALGVLTRAATGFSLQRGGARVTATALKISPQESARDQALVRQVHAERARGQALVAQRRSARPRGPERQPGKNGAQPKTEPSRPPAVQKPAAPKPALQHRGNGPAVPRSGKGKPHH